MREIQEYVLPPLPDIEELLQIISPSKVVRVEKRPSARFGEFAVPFMVEGFDGGTVMEDEVELRRAGGGEQGKGGEGEWRKGTDLAESHDEDGETHDSAEDFGEEHEHSWCAVLPVPLLTPQALISLLSLGRWKGRKEEGDETHLPLLPKPHRPPHRSEAPVRGEKTGDGEVEEEEEEVAFVVQADAAVDPGATEEEKESQYRTGDGVRTKASAERKIKREKEWAIGGKEAY